MRIIRPKLLHKPPLGSPLAYGNLANGLQIGAILNEGGGLLNSVGMVRNLTGRHHGTVSGDIGIGTLLPFWLPTKQGTGFINRNSGTTGAIDFGVLSSYPTFTNITMIVMAACYNSPGVARTFVCANGSTGTLAQIIINTGPLQWQAYISTVAGSQGPINMTPTFGLNDNRFCDMIALTYDGSNFIGYLNGKKIGTIAANSPLSYDNTAHIFLSGWAGTNGQQHTAPITAAYLWTRALSAAEIQQIYLDPYWALTQGLHIYRPSAPLPGQPTPTGGPKIPLVGSYATSKSGFGINQKIITIPEMNSFDEVRQAMAQAIRELQNHIATQLPIVDYKQRKITNVAPPTNGDDVVTLKYLQSVQLPAQPKSN